MNANRLTEVSVTFADGRRATYEIDPDHWDLGLERETDKEAGASGYYELVALPSGRIKLEARFLHSALALQEVPLGPRVELRCLLGAFRDETQSLDVTPYQAAERKLIAGVQGWSLLLQSTGAQAMSPGNMLKWIEDHIGSGPARVTIAPEASTSSKIAADYGDSAK